MEKKSAVNIRVSPLLSAALTVIAVLIELFRGVRLMPGVSMIGEAAIIYAAVTGIYLISYNISVRLTALVPSIFGGETDTERESFEGEGDINYEGVTVFYGEYSEGLCRVERRIVSSGNVVPLGYNFMDENGRYISDVWYEAVTAFKDGSAVVYTNGMYNLIDRNGCTILDDWAASMSEFSESGFSRLVMPDGKVNFFDRRNCRLVWDEWKEEKL